MSFSFYVRFHLKFTFNRDYEHLSVELEFRSQHVYCVP